MPDWYGCISCVNAAKSSCAGEPLISSLSGAALLPFTVMILLSTKYWHGAACGWTSAGVYRATASSLQFKFFPCWWWFPFRGIPLWDLPVIQGYHRHNLSFPFIKWNCLLQQQPLPLFLFLAVFVPGLFLQFFVQTRTRGATVTIVSAS